MHWFNQLHALRMELDLNQISDQSTLIHCFHYIAATNTAFFVLD